MIIWGVVILGAGLFILRVGGSVDPVLLGGPVILISGILVMRGQPAAMRLYFLGLVGMCVWLAVAKSVPVAIAASRESQCRRRHLHKSAVCANREADR